MEIGNEQRLRIYFRGLTRREYFVLAYVVYGENLKFLLECRVIFRVEYLRRD